MRALLFAPGRLDAWPIWEFSCREPHRWDETLGMERNPIEDAPQDGRLTISFMPHRVVEKTSGYSPRAKAAS